MRRWIYAMGCLGLVLWDAMAHAQGVERALDVLDAGVSYSANYAASDGHGLFTGKVWHEPGRERRDFATKHGEQTALLRRDMDAAYLINSTAHWYVAVSFRAAVALADGLDELTVNRQKIGPDPVEGQKTTRYHISAHAKSGRAFEGDLWALASGVPVKLAGTASEANGRQTEVMLVQTNIVVGPVNRAVAMEPPQGYMAINLQKIPPEKLVQTVQSMAPLLNGGIK